MTDNKPIRVVCIDDEPQMLELYGFILLRKTNLDSGMALFELHVADDVHTGWGLILEMEPKLIILDLGMPHIMDLHEQIRTDVETKDIPAICIYAKSNPESLRKLRQILVDGLDFLVFKPFLARDFMKAVAEALRQNG